MCSELLTNYFARIDLQLYQPSRKSQEEMQRQRLELILCAIFLKQMSCGSSLKQHMHISRLQGRPSTVTQLCRFAWKQQSRGCIHLQHWRPKEGYESFVHLTQFLLGFPLHESFLQAQNDYWAIFTPSTVTVTKTSDFITDLWYWVFLKHQLLESGACGSWLLLKTPKRSM